MYIIKKDIIIIITSNTPLFVGSRDAMTGPFNTAQRYFKYSEVVSITNNFERVLGKGGFGEVYHGISDGDQVAVKILSEESAQGYKEFRAEVGFLKGIIL